jgi:hypothetical protein
VEDVRPPPPNRWNLEEICQTDSLRCVSIRETHFLSLSFLVIIIIIIHSRMQPILGSTDAVDI